MTGLKVSCILESATDKHEIDEDATIADAIDVMKQAHYSSLLVLDHDGRQVGILSERDIVRAFAEEGENAKTAYVGDYMTRGIISVKEDEPIDNVIDLMIDKNIRHIPIVDADGTPSGFLSIMEILRARKKAGAG